jgi:phospholipid/cholesterol/gamma-HCH transport system ATP-binding protein
MLDDLILELRDSLGTTIVVVTHELASIFTIGDNAVFLDPETKTMLAVGNPKAPRDTSPNAKSLMFLNRGASPAAATTTDTQESASCPPSPGGSGIG